MAWFYREEGWIETWFFNAEVDRCDCCFSRPIYIQNNRLTCSVFCSNSIWANPVVGPFRRLNVIPGVKATAVNRSNTRARIRQQRFDNWCTPKPPHSSGFFLKKKPHFAAPQTARTLWNRSGLSIYQRLWGESMKNRLRMQAEVPRRMRVLAGEMASEREFQDDGI